MKNSQRAAVALSPFLPGLIIALAFFATQAAAVYAEESEPKNAPLTEEQLAAENEGEMTLSQIVESGLLTPELKKDVADFSGPLDVLLQSREDVEAYARVVAEANDEIKAISYGPDSLTVSYRDKGRFLSVIPMPAVRYVTVGMEGEVEVSKPWYGALLAGGAPLSDIAEDVERRVGANGEAAIRAFAVNATAVYKAELIRQVVNGIEESLGTF